MTTLTPKEVATRWFEGLWNDRNPRVIAELRAPSASSTGLARTAVRDYEDFYKRASALLTDTRVVLQDVKEEGDQVTAMVTLTGKMLGQDVTFRGVSKAHVQDGKVVSGQNTWDVSAVSTALGLAPTNDFAELFQLAETKARPKPPGTPLA